jgi:methionyl-tRNA formyltransferase
MNTYLVATTKPWNAEAFTEITPGLPGQWHLISDPDQLTVEFVRELAPRYVFFPHWSWRVPAELLSEVECVCFHMTDVPYGRGGAPLQNLIARGHKETVMTALQMVEEMDAGPVYIKRPLTLSGSAQEIYTRGARLAYEMMRIMINDEPEPVEQSGEVTLFVRRKPQDSELPRDGDAEAIYDHIRMLDADSYPRAFLRRGSHRLEFSNAQLVDGRVVAQVEISKEEPHHG